mgnify:CR=1 FL=1
MDGGPKSAEKTCKPTLNVDSGAWARTCEGFCSKNPNAITMAAEHEKLRHFPRMTIFYKDKTVIVVVE